MNRRGTIGFDIRKPMWCWKMIPRILHSEFVNYSGSYGFKHGWIIFHFIYGYIYIYMGWHPEPIDELHHFSTWLKPPTSEPSYNWCQRFSQELYAIYIPKIAIDFLMIPLVFTSSIFRKIPLAAKHHAFFLCLQKVSAFCSTKTPIKHKNLVNTGYFIMHPPTNTSASFYQPDASYDLGYTTFPKWLVDDAKSQKKIRDLGYHYDLGPRTPSYNIPSGNQTWQWNMILELNRGFVLENLRTIVDVQLLWWQRRVQKKSG